MLCAFCSCQKAGEAAADPEGLDELRSLLDEYLKYYCELFVNIHENNETRSFLEIFRLSYSV